MRKSILKAISLVGVIALAGCSSMSGSGSGSDSMGQNYADSNGATAYGAGQRSPFVGQYNRQTQALLNQRVFHFGFDKDVVRNTDAAAIAAHGKYLGSHPNAKITLEGHTDQRGSREYNIGLGERRDRSVEELLIMNGANASQIKLVSYGQEKPVSLGHTEADYAKNRRVEIVYKQYS